MKKLKESIRFGLRRSGWEVSHWPGANHLLGQVIEVIRAHDVDTVVDVGANVGQFAGSLRALGYAGRIESFEPEPSAYAQLADRAADDPDWHVHNLGLGAEPATMTLNVSSGTDMSSLLPINDNYLSWNHERGRVVGAVDVEVSTLDRQDISGERLLLKSDTQGYDRHVLGGGAETLARARGLLLELAVVPNYDGADNEWRPMLDFVLGEGFQPAGFFTIDRTELGQVREMDGLFVRV